MNRRAEQNHNQGQAAIEALLIIVAGFTLMLGVHHIGQLRSDTLHLLGESHFLSFVPKTTVNELGGLLSNAPINERYATARLTDLTYSAQQREIENQLGFDSTTLLRASAHSASRAQSDLWVRGLSPQAPLERHSFLLLGAGQADSTQAAQNQITGSTALWKESFALSDQLVNASRVTIQSIDHAWGRPTITSDWLLPWANDVLAPEPLKQRSVLPHADMLSRTLARGFK